MSGQIGDVDLGRADAALAAGDVDGAVAHLAAAIRALTAAGEPCRAALACARLGDVYATGLGNLTAARAWFARASRLVEGVEPCLEQGWVAVAPMGCDVDDPTDLLARAELALDRSRRFGDVNLEAKALADAGLAHVRSGRVPAGMGLLDEAMALVCGAADDVDSSGRSVCSFFTACHQAADYGRAGSWVAALRRRGLLGEAAGAPVFLSSHCDTVQAALLCELGRWGEAEALLLAAAARFEAVMPMPSWHPAIGLAELRIRQGRLADAERLLVGRDASLEALVPAARLHLARGDHDLARAAAARGLRSIGGDRLRAAELLATLVDAELAAGHHGAAVAAAARLAASTEGLELPILQARAAPVHARVLAAGSDLAGAISLLEPVVEDPAVAGAPWLRFSLLLELAGHRDRAGERAAAALDVRTAWTLLRSLDVVVPPAHQALLDRLGPTAPSAPTTASLSRDGRWWSLRSGSTEVRLPDTKGMRYLADLVAHPGVERHAFDLVDLVEGVGAGPGAIDRRLLGDAGAHADARARDAYRHRIEALRAEADGALAIGDERAAERLQAELDVLVDHLAAAFGLGGRSRRASSAAERARLNVTRAIRTATAKVAEALPGVGGTLDPAVRTGRYCAYDPAPGATTRWVVQDGVNAGPPG